MVRFSLHYGDYVQIVNVTLLVYYVPFKFTEPHNIASLVDVIVVDYRSGDAWNHNLIWTLLPSCHE